MLWLGGLGKQLHHLHDMMHLSCLIAYQRCHRLCFHRLCSEVLWDVA